MKPLLRPAPWAHYSSLHSSPPAEEPALLRSSSPDVGHPCSPCSSLLAGNRDSLRIVDVFHSDCQVILQTTPPTSDLAADRQARLRETLVFRDTAARAGRGRGARERVPLSWLRSFPMGIVIQRENLLDAFGPAAALVVQHFERLTDARQTRDRSPVRRGQHRGPMRSRMAARSSSLQRASRKYESRAVRDGSGDDGGSALARVRCRQSWRWPGKKSLESRLTS